MNFINVLLRAIGFLPSLVSGIEEMCQTKSGAEKKDAVMTFMENALAMSDAVAQREIVQPEQFQERCVSDH